MPNRADNTTPDRVRCGSCGIVLDERHDCPSGDRVPCPSCGSTKRAFDVSFSATVVARSKLGFEHRRPGYKKPIAEGVSGDDLHRKNGRWMRLSRLIDRLKNRYSERVVDPETGQVVHECDEALTEHRGHGSDRKPNA